MKVFLVRHGHAVDKAFNSGRPLSEQGKMEVLLLAEKLREENLLPEKIYHSKILRAEQTASILSKNLNLETQRYSHKKLNGENEFDFWKNFIFQQDQDIMLVGHNPFMQLFTEQLLPSSSFEFHTGSCICLEIESSEENRFVERWSYTRSISNFS